MQITTATKEELGLLIKGLRSFLLMNEKESAQQEKLLKQLENELSQRFGLVLTDGKP